MVGFGRGCSTGVDINSNVENTKPTRNKRAEPCNNSVLILECEKKKEPSVKKKKLQGELILC